MTSVKSLLLDTNILLRFFLRDVPDQAAAVKKLLQKAHNGAVLIEVPFTSIMEAVFTMRSFYKVGPETISRMLTGFLSGKGIRHTGPSWLLDAIEEFGQANASFGDICIAAEARSSLIVVASFDRDFDKFQGVERFEPA